MEVPPEKQDFDSTFFLYSISLLQNPLHNLFYPSLFLHLNTIIFFISSIQESNEETNHKPYQIFLALKLRTLTSKLEKNMKFKPIEIRNLRIKLSSSKP